MSVSLSSLEINDFIAARQKTREESWEQDFEKNHKIFANNLANGIAKLVIGKLKDTIKDPYQKTINFENRFISIVSLKIWGPNNAQKIINFTEGCEKLSPFNEWLEKSSAEQKQSDYHNYDYEYFEELMAIVGRLAGEKLNEIFSENKDLQYKVEWKRKSDQNLSTCCVYENNCLRIELWLNEKFIPKQMEKKSSTVIEQNRKETQKIRQWYYIKVAMTVVLIAVATMGLIILNPGIIGARFPGKY